MKLHFSILLCTISISLLSVTAEEDTLPSNMDELVECAGPYLKSKGKIEYSNPSADESSNCPSIIQTDLRSARQQYEASTKKHLPNESACLLREFDKHEAADFILKVLFYRHIKSLSESERNTHSVNIANEGQTLKRTFATACGIEEHAYDEYMRKDLEDKQASQRVTAEKDV